MKTLIRAVAGCVVGLGLCGCGTAESGGEGGNVDSQDPGAAPVSSPAPTATPAAPKAVYNEWREIWAVETQGGKFSRQQVGFLHRMFGDDDPAGKSFVLDMKRVTRGFILADGKAFVLEERPGERPVSRDLGNTGLENGAKKILDLQGEIQFQQIRPPASSDAGEAPATR
jgi:hypothetical protein